MTTWVLLRGLTRDARHWGDFPGALQGRLDTGPVVCIDLPGNGARHAERSPADVPGLVAACRQALRDGDLQPPYRLLALSLGGMLAVAWATIHPEEVLGAVLVNTSLRGFGAWHQRLRPRQYRRLLFALLSRDARAIEKTVLGMTSHHAIVAPETLLAEWTDFRRQRPVARANALRQLWAAARWRAPRSRPQVPLLLLASAADALVAVACSEQLARQWRTDLVVHPSAGHDLPLDAPEWVIDQIGRWLAQSPSSGVFGDPSN